MNASYSKLRSGAWGIRVKGIPEVGAKVSVAKKSGEVKVEVVAAVLWSGNGESLCSIVADESRARHPKRESLGARYKRKYGWDGVHGSPSYYSSGMYDEES